MLIKIKVKEKERIINTEKRHTHRGNGSKVDGEESQFRKRT